jgi:hypothetical protein
MYRGERGKITSAKIAFQNQCECLPDKQTYPSRGKKERIGSKAILLLDDFKDFYSHGNDEDDQVSNSLMVFC